MWRHLLTETTSGLFLELLYSSVENSFIQISTSFILTFYVFNIFVMHLCSFCSRRNSKFLYDMDDDDDDNLTLFKG